MKKQLLENCNKTKEKEKLPSVFKLGAFFYLHFNLSILKKHFRK